MRLPFLHIYVYTDPKSLAVMPRWQQQGGIWRQPQKAFTQTHLVHAKPMFARDSNLQASDHWWMVSQMYRRAQQQHDPRNSCTSFVISLCTLDTWSGILLYEGFKLKLCKPYQTLSGMGGCLHAWNSRIQILLRTNLLLPEDQPESIQRMRNTHYRGFSQHLPAGGVQRGVRMLQLVCVVRTRCVIWFLACYHQSVVFCENLKLMSLPATDWVIWLPFDRDFLQ